MSGAVCVLGSANENYSVECILASNDCAPEARSGTWSAESAEHRVHVRPARVSSLVRPSRFSLPGRALSHAQLRAITEARIRLYSIACPYIHAIRSHKRDAKLM